MRFNHLFILLLAVGITSSLFISPQITARAQGKEELLLYPIIRPVRAIAGMFHRKYAAKTLPPGETRPRTDTELSAENIALRQQVIFLKGQLESLQLVESERKQLGPLLDYFKPVTVLGGDATPTRETLTLLPASGVDFSVGTPVMYSDGLVGRIVEGRRVRLITDKDFTITGEFGHWEDGKFKPLGVSKAAVRGIGNGAMRVENLPFKEADQVIKPGDWIVVKDMDFSNDPRQRDIVQNRQIGQVESINPLPAKPLFAEIIIKPRTDLRKLREVLVMRK